MSFSKKMEELDSIVARIEKGPMPLEDALALFEKGVKLVKECREYLLEAKGRVRALTEEGELVPLSQPLDYDGEGSR
ncbi:MAG: exodeoxyribonuclease VII small subunit [Synergistaceae bacterium]|nr:exodeoxyribonuclease VII small subunit [Synergistaceae bacterium]